MFLAFIIKIANLKPPTPKLTVNITTLSPHPQ